MVLSLVLLSCELSVSVEENPGGKKFDMCNSDLISPRIFFSSRCNQINMLPIMFFLKKNHLNRELVTFVLKLLTFYLVKVSCL